MILMFETHCTLSHFCEHNGPKIEFIVQVARQRGRQREASVVSEPKYCTAAGERWVFEGSFHSQRAWTATLRGICIRCLSVESLGGDAKAMCFGDNSQGYTCFYLFKIPDSQARGGARQLCISLTNHAPQVRH